MRVLDVGGGKRPAISPKLKKDLELYVVGLDVSEQELGLAPDGAYEQIIVGDVADVHIHEAFDLIVSCAVMEHVQNPAKAVVNLAGALLPGGQMAHFIPCTFAPFAMFNRLIGNQLARRLLFRLHPDTEDAQGFKAY